MGKEKKETQIENRTTNTAQRARSQFRLCERAEPISVQPKTLGAYRMVALWTKRRENLEDKERVLSKSLVYSVKQQERPEKTLATHRYNNDLKKLPKFATVGR